MVLFFFHPPGTPLPFPLFQHRLRRDLLHDGGGVRELQLLQRAGDARRRPGRRLREPHAQRFRGQGPVPGQGGGGQQGSGRQGADALGQRAGAAQEGHHAVADPVLRAERRREKKKGRTSASQSEKEFKPHVQELLKSGSYKKYNLLIQLYVLPYQSVERKTGSN